MQATEENIVIEESSERAAIFSIVCGAHFINHFQSAMLGVVYPLMMKELGMTYLAIASLAAVYNTLGSFGPAFSVISISYFLVMSFLALLRTPEKGHGLAQA